jgi:WD40 repeat protein
MSTTPATPTRWQRIRGHIKEARWPLVAFLATAVVLWWWLPARPDVVLPEGLEFLGYSRDGKALITTQAYGTTQAYAGSGIPRWQVVRGPIQLWDCATGRELRRFAEGEGNWSGVLPSPDGSRVATLGRSGLRIWDVAAGRLLAAPPGQWDQADGDDPRYDPGIDWCFSPDGALLAYLAPSDRPDANPSRLLSLRIWDVARGRERAVIEDVELKRDSWTNWRIAFSPDGRTLAASALLSEPPARPGEAPRRTPVVQLWDVAAARERAVLQAHSASVPFHGVSFITFSADGRTVAAGASGVYPSEVTLWDVATGQQRVLPHSR